MSLPSFIVVHVDRHGRAVAECLHCRERQMLTGKTKALFDAAAQTFAEQHHLCLHTATCPCALRKSPDLQLSLLEAV